MELNSIARISNHNSSKATIFTSYNDLKKNVVKIKGISETEPWELFNAVGKQVLRGLGIAIDVQNLPSGLYLLEVRGELHRIIK